MNIPNSTSGSSSQSAAKLGASIEQPTPPLVPSGDRLIYVLHEQRQIGPLTRAKVRESLASGTITPADLAWCEGHTDWIPLGQLLADCPPLRPSINRERQEINPLTVISFRYDKFGNPKLGGWLKVLYILIALALLACVGQLAHSIATGECSLDALSLGLKKYKIAPAGPVAWPGQFFYAAMDSFPLADEDFTHFGERNVIVGHLRGVVGYFNALMIVLAALLMPDLWIAPKTSQALRLNRNGSFSRWVPASRQLLIAVGWMSLISGGFDIIEGIRMWMGEVFWSAGPSLALGLAIVLYTRASLRVRETLPSSIAHEPVSVDDLLAAKGILSPFLRLTGIAGQAWRLAFGAPTRSRIARTSVSAVAIILVVSIINTLAASVLRDGAEDGAMTRFLKPVIADTIQGATDLGAVGAIGGTFVAPGAGTVAGGGAGIIIGGGLGLLWGIGHGLWNVWNGNSEQLFGSWTTFEERLSYPVKPLEKPRPVYEDPTRYKPEGEPENREQK